MSISNDKKLARWQFRKKKKIERRQKKRQEIAKNKELIPAKEPVKSIEEDQQYQKDKQLWEEKEQRFKLIELAKKRAREKEAEARELAQKKWKDTLLKLPMMPPRLSLTPTAPMISTTTSTPFKTFVLSSDTNHSRKTYRERYLEKKKQK